MRKRPSTDHPEFKKAERDIRAKIDNLLKINGKRSLDSIHRELGTLLWDKCGMARNKSGLEEALRKIPELREKFWREVRSEERRVGKEGRSRGVREGEKKKEVKRVMRA